MRAVNNGLRWHYPEHCSILGSVLFTVVWPALPCPTRRWIRPLAHDHLYEPVPCSYWPEDLLHAVGTAYREARGKGLEGGVSLDHAEAAYIGAGGAATHARTLVLGILASLSVERGDWLWGPAQVWHDRQPPAATDLKVHAEADGA